MELNYTSASVDGLSNNEIIDAIKDSLREEKHQNALLIVPDYTRYHSNAGFITNVYYHELCKSGCQVDILEALGSHVPMTTEEIKDMYGDIPEEVFIAHNWRKDVVKIGEVPGDFVSKITDGLWSDPVEAEINSLVMEEKYDLILSIGQVVPHEVIGMSNHAKNLFVGVGGSDMINKSHMIGAVYGMERMMGKDHTPVRQIFDYSLENFLGNRPIRFVLTVTTAPGGKIHTHGLFIGDTRKVLENAVKEAQHRNIDFVEKGIEKCIVYLDPSEFKSTWLGNKAIYRTRMAMADGGDLLILAPGVKKFGEDDMVDSLIRKYGYRGRLNILEKFKEPENGDLRENMGTAAHLIHGSSDGRFNITYAVESISREEIENVGFGSADYKETIKKYDPSKLEYGYNVMPDGERIYYIPNPALGLWIDKSRFTE